MPRLFTSRHALSVALLVALTLLYWSRVLFTSHVLLPGEMLLGFAPFGAEGSAPWNILQWDALAQYYPWRHFAAQQLQSGLIPLWNPHQFSGAPFIANGQSAVFYPLNFPFWVVDVARAFGVSAALHTLLASLSTYALLQRWRLSRAASLLGAIAFGFCGYLAAWVLLPTLANTASWLPLGILLLEKAVEGVKVRATFKAMFALLAVAIACSFLAGHAQIFFYILVALALRALLLRPLLRAVSTLVAACALAGFLGAIQALPTLELARLGHRAGATPTVAGWENFLAPRALQGWDLPSLFVFGWPQSYSFSENFGYVGAGVLALVVFATIAFLIRREYSWNEGLQRRTFAVALPALGVLYATATPLAKAFYFYVPGLAQMGGVGRALLLWSFGAALLAAFGLDALRRRWSTPVIPVLALLLISGELFAYGILQVRTAPRATIYPATAVTQFLQSQTQDGSRVLLLTPRATWLPPEGFPPGSPVRRPAGVLPPNGAMVYGLNDVNGYDSLAPRAYREFLVQGEDSDVSPQLNGNMILLENLTSPALDQLNVRYVVSQNPLQTTGLREVLRADGCIVYQRAVQPVPQLSGRDFSPGWREGKYQPEPFRLGAFLSLCALCLTAFLLCSCRVNFLEAV